MDETEMGVRLEDKETRIGRTESQRAGLEIQLGSRKSRGRRGRISDAKNWGLNKERQSLKERRARVGKCKREGGPQHGPGREEECSSAAQRSVKRPMCQKNGLRLWDQDVSPRETEGMREHGPIKTRLCTTKHWVLGEKEESGRRAG